MSEAIVMPTEFYRALSNGTPTGFNMKQADEFTVYLPSDYMTRPLIFIINTSDEGSHWVFIFIDNSNEDYAKHLLYFIDPYGYQLHKEHGVIEKNIQKWYSVKIKDYFHTPLSRLKVCPWTHLLPKQNCCDNKSCGIICAMYAYYLLTQGRFPTITDWKNSNEMELCSFMVKTLLTSNKMCDTFVES
jgi:hypothetical protein